MSVFQVLRLSVPLSANTMPQADSQQESNPFRGIHFSSGEVCTPEIASMPGAAVVLLRWRAGNDISWSAWARK